MRVRLYMGDKCVSDQDRNITRAETTHVCGDGQQFTVFMLDADDSLDLVVHYPNGQREIVWSLVKD